MEIHHARHEAGSPEVSFNFACCEGVVQDESQWQALRRVVKSLEGVCEPAKCCERVGLGEI